MITYIESSSNAIFKNTKKLLNSKDRKKSKLFITEGYRSVSDACSNGAAVEYIVVSESYSKECFEEQYKVYRMADKLFNEISSTVNSQGIIAVVHFVDRDETELDTDAVYNVLYLDCVMDLELMVATEDMAKNLADRFKKNPEKIFSGLLTALYGEYSE